MGVAIFDRDGKRAAALAAELGSDARAVEGDVTDDDDVAAAVEAARSLGALSLVVNVAGGGDRRRPHRRPRREAARQGRRSSPRWR